MPLRWPIDDRMARLRVLSRKNLSYPGGAVSMHKILILLAASCSQLPLIASPQFVPGPAPRRDHSMAYDPARDVAVLFGGEILEGRHRANDTWEWNGTAWSPVAGDAPPALAKAFMASNATGAGVLLFGGVSDAAISDQTWVYTDAKWTAASPAQRPLARIMAAGALHAATGRVVLFGGVGDKTGALGDTWLWDGAAWTEVHPSASPPPRYAAAACYDPVRRKVVLFGGREGNTVHNDTWEWDGTTWTQVPARKDLQARQDARMLFQAATGKVLLFGGRFVEVCTGTLGFDGEHWAELTPGLAPDPDDFLACVDMGAKHDPVCFGGERASTWCLGAAGWRPMLGDSARRSGLSIQKYAVRGEARPKSPTIDRALGWLTRHQSDDGRWDADGFMAMDREEPKCDGPGAAVFDVGITGLALLALLAESDSIEGSPYDGPIRRGLGWLRRQQDELGLFGGNSCNYFIYNHAIATYAMCEAAALTVDPAVRWSAQAGIDYLEKHRNPYAVWRYQPRDNDNDSSVTAWCVMAYTTAQDIGLEVPANSLRFAEIWFDQVSDPTGRHGYTKQGERGSRLPGEHSAKFPIERTEGMTALGLMSRFALGQDPEEKRVMKAAGDLILTRRAVWDVRAGVNDLYYWYWASQAMWQLGGRSWELWRGALHPALGKNQRTDGNFAGSWDPSSTWGEMGGRLYSTAMATLSLQAEYRYARLSTLAPLPSDAVYRPANDAWRAGTFGKFKTLLDGLAEKGAGDEAVAAAVAAARFSLDVTDARCLKRVQEIRQARDYWSGKTELEGLSNQCGTLAAGEAARALLAEWRDDKAVRREFAAMAEYERILKRGHEAKTDSARQAVRRDFERHIRTFEGTKAAEYSKKSLAETR